MLLAVQASRNGRERGRERERERRPENEFKKELSEKVKLRTREKHVRRKVLKIHSSKKIWPLSE